MSTHRDPRLTSIALTARFVVEHVRAHACCALGKLSGPNDPDWRPTPLRALGTPNAAGVVQPFAIRLWGSSLRLKLLFYTTYHVSATQNCAVPSVQVVEVHLVLGDTFLVYFGAFLLGGDWNPGHLPERSVPGKHSPDDM